MCSFQQSGFSEESNNESTNFGSCSKQFSSFNPVGGPDDECGMVDEMMDVWWSQWCGGDRPANDIHQTVDSENDMEDSYVDYSCMSSGILSPDFVTSSSVPPVVTSRFNTLLDRVHKDGTTNQCALDSSSFRFFQDVSGSDGNGLFSLPPSPVFHHELINGYEQDTYSDCNFGRQLSDFGSEEEAVREIARYLASFEVQPCSENTPLDYASTNQRDSATAEVARRTQHVSSGSLGVSFYSGDLETGLNAQTVVYSNNVSPIRADHGYAAKPPHHSRQKRKATVQSSRSRRHSDGRHVSCSVLEAFLTSTRLIDPNKGSNAALAEEINLEKAEDIFNPGKNIKVASCQPDRLLKKLLTGEVDQQEMMQDRKRVIDNRNRRLLEVTPAMGSPLDIHPSIASPHKLMDVEKSTCGYMESELQEATFNESDETLARDQTRTDLQLT